MWMLEIGPDWGAFLVVVQVALCRLEPSNNHIIFLAVPRNQVKGGVGQDALSALIAVLPSDPWHRRMTSKYQLISEATSALYSKDPS